MLGYYADECRLNPNVKFNTSCAGTSAGSVSSKSSSETPNQPTMAGRTSQPPKRLTYDEQRKQAKTPTASTNTSTSTAVNNKSVTVTVTAGESDTRMRPCERKWLLCTLELNAFKKRQVAIKQMKRVAKQARKVHRPVETYKAICTAELH